jgi:uncharacterized protein YkwD
LTRAIALLALLSAAPLVGAAEPISHPPGDIQPAATYSTSRDITDEDYDLAVQVAAEWPRLRYSSALGTVARAYAMSSERLDPNPPSSAEVRRWLQIAGAPESDAVAATVLTSEHGTRDVLDHLRTVLPRSAASHVGLGRCPAKQAPFRWRWAIVLVDRKLDLHKPVPKTVAPGAGLLLSFSIRPGLTQPRVIVQAPGGQTRTLVPAASRDDTWFTVAPTGGSTGRMVVQILATGPSGPRTIANMPIQIGEAELSSVTTPPDQHRSPPEHVDSTEEAAAHLFKLMNSARQARGLDPLTWDGELAAIASEHSADMVANGFFGHTSRRSGTLEQRMSTSGYRAAVFRENLAKDISISSAHESLMASPGHRSNILAEDVSRIGIGIASEHRSGELRHWVITQVFAKPLSDVIVPTTYDYPPTQESTCERDPRLDRLAAWLFDNIGPAGEVSETTENELRRRTERSGVAWQRMLTRTDFFASLDEARAAALVAHRDLTLCGAASDVLRLDDGRTGFLRVALFVEPQRAK